MKKETTIISLLFLLILAIPSVLSIRGFSTPLKQISAGPPIRIELSNNKPDLSIPGLSVNYAYLPNAMLQVNVFASIENTGNRRAAPTTARIQINDNTFVDIPTPVIGVNQFRLVNASFIIPQNSFTVKVIADYPNTLVELDETNNQLSTFFFNP